jgi:hypothetical protein
MPSRSLVLGSFLVAACVAIGLGYGFTVDDALISTRVAHQLRSHAHYGFNREGPAVDCVTPLGWAWLLAPFSSSGPWAGFVAARVLGVLSALVSASLLGQLVWSTRLTERRPVRVVLVSVVLATSLPFGAWASSGMETSVAMLLCTASVWGFANGRWLGPCAAGLAAAWRPEIVPWAAVMALLSEAPRTLPAHETAQQAMLARLRRLVVVLAPVATVMTVRYFVFRSAVPLAVWAKPSDGAHGWMYTWGALRFLGFPILLLGRRAFARLPRIGVALALAFAAHVLTVVGVGGDWMSLFRLFVPVIPATLWLSILILNAQSTRVVMGKGLVALAANTLLVYSLGASSRQVLGARRELIASVSPTLQSAKNVAALDVGWVGVATSGTITDLAGVTDPEIARLPGGHTSKHLPANLLVRRNVDALVLLLAPEHPTIQVGMPLSSLRFARAVENSLYRQEQAERYAVESTIPLRGTAQQYVVLRKRLEPTPE